MTDIRVELAEEVAVQIGAVVLPERCVCRWPLMVKPEQGMPFCWGCTTDKKTAFEGRALLLKAKLAAIGQEMPSAKPWVELRSGDRDDDEKPFSIGMPV